MAWDFQTDPDYQAQLDWVSDFIRDEVEPADRLIEHPLDMADPLRNALLKRSDSFAANAASKLMTYALGRPVTYHEMPAVRAVLQSAAQQNNRFGAIVLGIVKSQPFLTRTKPAGKIGPPVRSTEADMPKADLPKTDKKRKAA